MTQPLETCGTHEAFECPQCGKRYGDALYHGPWPHAPLNICVHCWAVAWEKITANMQTLQDWTELDEALVLISQGFTQSEAATFIGKHRTTLWRWIQRRRKFFAKSPRIMQHKHDSSGIRRHGKRKGPL